MNHDDELVQLVAWEIERRQQQASAKWNRLSEIEIATAALDVAVPIICANERERLASLENPGGNTQLSVVPLDGRDGSIVGPPTPLSRWLRAQGGEA